MSRIPVPTDGFVSSLEKVGRHGTQRWRNPEGGLLYEWDGLHGHFEVYTAQGRHRAVVDVNGKYVADAVKGRRIDV